ncbi:MAG: endo alpha-1,4 polygalactosaminidase [Myxococcales bacterium]|nr:endo alpha-1,4 polygalactosaminidase [Myxococcales bacterium]
MLRADSPGTIVIGGGSGEPHTRSRDAARLRQLLSILRRRLRRAAATSANTQTPVRIRLIPALLVFALGQACGGGDDAAATVTVDPSVEVEQTPGAPVCVWNQAYQENTEPDAITDILAGASNCYVLIDPFDEPAARAAVPALHEAGNTVGCYLSSGTCEDWRDDFEALRPSCAARAWGQWAGEYFVSDVATAAPLMEARLDQLAEWGCDMVEFDNMDWAEDETSIEHYHLEVDAASGAAYNARLCAYARQRGMECMAKNTRLGGDDFTGGTFESYPDELDWWDHDALQSFVDAGQLAIVVHYDERDCDTVALWYRQRYGSGISFLCEDRAAGGYRH